MNNVTINGLLEGISVVEKDNFMNSFTLSDQLPNYM